MDPRLFYKHRGLERAAEGREHRRRRSPTPSAPAPPARSPTRSPTPTRARARSACVPDRDLRVGRTLLLELERLYNHLHDIGAICAGVGFAPGTMAFAALKDRAQRVNARLAGHRFLFGTVAVGRGTLELDAVRGRRDARRAARAARRRGGGLARAGVRRQRAGAPRRRRRARCRGRAAAGNESVPRRARRACAHDVRTESPRLWYGGLRAGHARRRHGRRRRSAAAARRRARDHLRPPRRAARRADRAGDRAAGREPSARRWASAASRARAGRRSAPSSSTATASGACACAPAPTPTGPRSRTRRAGNLLPDFPLINKSFELCYACVDR